MSPADRLTEAFETASCITTDATGGAVQPEPCATAVHFTAAPPRERAAVAICGAGETPLSSWAAQRGSVQEEELGQRDESFQIVRLEIDDRDSQPGLGLSLRRAGHLFDLAGP